MLALLRSLTDSDLLSRVRGIVIQERKLTLLLLLHLNESVYLRIGGDFHPGHDGFAIEQRVRFTFAASPGFQQKVDRVKSLAWHRLRGDLSLEHVIELALDCYIEKHDPYLRQKRREKRKRQDAS